MVVNTKITGDTLETAYLRIPQNSAWYPGSTLGDEMVQLLPLSPPPPRWCPRAGRKVQLRWNPGLSGSGCFLFPMLPPPVEFSALHHVPRAAFSPTGLGAPSAPAAEGRVPVHFVQPHASCCTRSLFSRCLSMTL